MNHPSNRSDKGKMIELLISKIIGGVHVDEKGYDVLIPKDEDGFYRGESKFGPVATKSRVNGSYIIRRKLSNSLTTTKSPTHTIDFDLLIVSSQKEVIVFFSDEITNSVYSVPDGFEFKSDVNNGHLIFRLDDEDVHDPPVESTYGVMKLDFMKGYAEYILSSNNTRRKPRFGPARRDATKRQTIRYR